VQSDNAQLESIMQQLPEESQAQIQEMIDSYSESGQPQGEGQQAGAEEPAPEDEKMTSDKSEYARKRARESCESYNVTTDGVPTEMGRLIEEALRCLEGTDLRGANAALEKACTEAASPRKDAGLSINLGADDGAAQRNQETRKGSEVRW
jgi:hypothetical protein